MATWCRERGLELMPHAKTTMAPTLWQRQLDAGALGLTLATMGQVRTARSLGFDSIMLANAVVDERALRWLAAELADPAFRFVAGPTRWRPSRPWRAACARPGRRDPVDVCVELGAAGGRTGARTVAEAVAVAERDRRVRRAAAGRRRGLRGLPRARPVAAGARRGPRLPRPPRRAAPSVAPLYDDGEVYVTAGGSAYFDLVAEAFAAPADRRGPTRFTSCAPGAYIVHDDGFYRGISPFDEAAGPDAPRLRVAMHGLARVVSRPEPGLALLDGGKRDFPYDEGLPIPRRSAADLAGPWRPLAGAQVSAMNDQHTYLRPTGPRRRGPPVGSVVALGLSHPCTAFDKWRVLPVVESAESDVVVDLVRTYF